MSTMKEENKKKSNVPNLRFPEFTGEWETVYLEDICDKIGDGIHSTPQYDENGDYFFINGNNFVEGTIQISETTKRVTKKEAKQHNIKHLTGNTILISINGTIGNLALYNNEPVMLGKSACYINPQKRNDRLFIFYQLGSKRVYKYFVSELTGSTIKNLSLKSIRQTIFHLPSIEEQNKISSLLFLIDQRISTQNKIIEDLRLLKSTISNLLLRNPNWKKYKIKDIGELGRGRVISTTEIKSQQTPKYPVYSSQTSNNGIMGYLDTYAFEGEYLTWTTDGANAGTVFYRKGKFNCTNVCGTIKVNDQHNPYFVSQCLQLVTRKYVSTDLANPKLMNNTMASIEITLPDKETQEFISDLLWCIDEKYSLENELFSRHMDVKKYLLSNLFV